MRGAFTSVAPGFQKDSVWIFIIYLLSVIPSLDAPSRTKLYDVHRSLQTQETDRGPDSVRGLGFGCCCGSLTKGHLAKGRYRERCGYFSFPQPPSSRMLFALLVVGATAFNGISTLAPRHAGAVVGARSCPPAMHISNAILDVSVQL